MKKRAEQLDKKHDKSISKTEQGIRKIEEVIKNIASIERKIQLLERPAGPMLRPPQNTQVNTPVPVFANTGVNIPQPMQHVNMSAPPLMNAPERNNDMRTNSPLNADVFVPNSARQQQTWAEIVQNTRHRCSVKTQSDR